jgi:hypothetical protein
MAEYIDKEKLLEELKLTFCKDCHQYKDIHCRSCYIDDVLLEIEDMPTADVVPVVRCKDCEHYKTDSYYCQKTKQGYCELDNNVKQKQGYCSYGERRCK